MTLLVVSKHKFSENGLVYVIYTLLKSCLSTHFANKREE